MAASEAQFSTVIGHYRLDRELGRGATAAVFHAEDLRDGTHVAVQVIHPQLGGDEAFRTQFQRRARAWASLRSPHTVHLVDYGLADGTCYLVMEFVEGTTLARLMNQGPLDPMLALGIATEVAHGLAEWGAHGLVHGDIRPENVLLENNGRVKVTDFGSFVGNADPAYSAPEQVYGDGDQRADIYALGVTLFTMLVGHPPFQGQTMFQILEQHRSASLPLQPLAHLSDVLVNVIRRCMEKDPPDRYASAAELVGALVRARARMAGSEPPDRRPPMLSSLPVGRPDLAPPGADRPSPGVATAAPVPWHDTNVAVEPSPAAPLGGPSYPGQPAASAGGRRRRWGRRFAGSTVSGPRVRARAS